MGGRGAIGKSQRKTKSESKLSDVVSDIIHGGNSNSTNDNYQIQNNLKDAEKSIMKEPVEHMYIFDENGNYLDHKSNNNNNNVSFSKDDGKIMKNAIVTHNHPSGFAFSPHDIFVFEQYKIKELRVVTSEGKIFSLTRASNKSLQKLDTLLLEMDATYNYIDNKSKAICNKIKNHYNKNKASEKIVRLNKISRNSYNNWLMKNVTRYGFSLAIIE